jgi:hypothetical protein
MKKLCEKMLVAVLLMSLTLMLSGAALAAGAVDPGSLNQQRDQFIKQQTDKFRLNLEAYKDITFLDMFGPELSASGTAHVQGSSRTLTNFFETINASLKTYGASQAPDASVNKVLALLGGDTGLIKFLSANKTSSGISLGAIAVKSLFEGVFTAATPDPVIKTLFSKHFSPLEGAGLTLPWLYLKDTDYAQYTELTGKTAFLQRLGAMSYDHFMFMPINHALLDKEAIELIQKASNLGMFGGWYAYAESPKTVVDPANLAAVRVANYCCNKSTVKCQAGAGNCANCGPICCVSSTYCSS